MLLCHAVYSCVWSRKKTWFISAVQWSVSSVCGATMKKKKLYHSDARNKLVLLVDGIRPATRRNPTRYFCWIATRNSTPNFCMSFLFQSNSRMAETRSSHFGFPLHSFILSFSLNIYIYCTVYVSAGCYFPTLISFIFILFIVQQSSARLPYVTNILVRSSFARQ